MSTCTLPWLAHVHRMEDSLPTAPLRFPVETDTLYVIKTMLLSPERDNSAVVNHAVQALRSYYADIEADDAHTQPISTSDLMTAVVDHVFRLAGLIPLDEAAAHTRLAGLLAGLTQLGWDSSPLSSRAVAFWTDDNPLPTTLPSLTRLLNTHHLLARLTALSSFPPPTTAPARAAVLISTNLQHSHPPAPNSTTTTAFNPLITTYHAAVAAEYILHLSGTPAAAEALNAFTSSNPAEDIETWPDALGRVAWDVPDEEAAKGVEAWGVKERTGEARRVVDAWLARTVVV
ncbi:hypothetical protein VTJ49DRAFT_7187 [Mycothermus thermophilus]|uniref:Uncharacterized protein n=1 Tax=Humicola insolens TaxID=85995 RepID=A0ABR3VQN2_HUMIN